MAASADLRAVPRDLLAAGSVVPGVVAESIVGTVEELHAVVRAIANLMDVCAHEGLRERDPGARARSIERADLALALLETAGRALEDPQLLSRRELVGLLQATTARARELRDHGIDTVVAASMVPDYPATDD